MREPSFVAGVLGLVGGILVLGPALGRGSLLNLDLVLTPRLPVSAGWWGLGPEVPRGEPLGAAMSVLSQVVGGPLVGKLLMLACFAVASAGAARLARPAAPVLQIGSGLLFGLSPYLMTRAAVGHFTIMAAAALLPWAVPTLLRPGTSLRRTFLWSLALACTGSFGGIVALGVVVVGLAVERGRRWSKVLLVVVFAQAVWLVPGVVVLAQGLTPAGAAQFPTQLHSLGDVLSLPAGHGFWQDAFPFHSVGLTLIAVIGTLLVVLAVLGSRKLQPPLTVGLPVLAGAGLLLTVASGTPGVDRVFEAFSRGPLGSPFRESQRFFVLTLLWLAPAVALGVERLATRVGPVGRPAVRLLPACVALILLVPGLWGVGGLLAPVQFPPEWAEAKRVTDQEPGTILALPWNRYLDLDFAGGRRVFNPVRRYFGGDVLMSGDPELGAGVDEAADPRAITVSEILPSILVDQPISGRLADLHVRWVVLVKSAYYANYANLADDPGLEVVGGRADGPVAQGARLAWFRGRPRRAVSRCGSSGAALVEDRRLGCRHLGPGRRPRMAPGMVSGGHHRRRSRGPAGRVRAGLVLAQRGRAGYLCHDGARYGDGRGGARPGYPPGQAIVAIASDLT